MTIYRIDSVLEHQWDQEIIPFPLIADIRNIVPSELIYATWLRTKIAVNSGKFPDALVAQANQEDKQIIQIIENIQNAWEAALTPLERERLDPNRLICHDEDNKFAVSAALNRRERRQQYINEVNAGDLGPVLAPTDNMFIFVAPISFVDRENNRRIDPPSAANGTTPG